MGSLLTAFAGIALLLSVVGVFAATAYAVRQRSHEIGVRMGLGVQVPQVVWLFVRRGVTLLAIVLPISLAGAAAGGLLLRGLLIQTRPTDPLTLVLIAGLVCVVTIAACLIPPRRAAPRTATRWPCCERSDRSESARTDRSSRSTASRICDGVGAAGPSFELYAVPRHDRQHHRRADHGREVAMSARPCSPFTSFGPVRATHLI